MNQLPANILTNLPDDFLLIGFGIIAMAFITTLCAVIWLSRWVFRLKRDCANLTVIVNGNKNDIYGLCSAALSVNETTAMSHQQLHDLKKQLAHVAEKVSELERSDFVNSAYNVDIRKIRDGANVDELMKQSDLSYDEAALLIRLHGKA